ncbi:MAG: class I SAM-dependent methyltransferase [Theionarchaea archaeon]|nr:class I SAM-dependent methyltransferase [Theionarchaea archaeon]
MRMEEPTLSEGERQLLDAILSIELYPDDEETGKKLISTSEGLRNRGIVIAKAVSGHQAKVPDWTDAFTSLVSKGLIKREGSLYVLTPLGRPSAVKARTERVGRRYDNFFLRSERSATYSAFCERSLGRDLCQHNVTDMLQLEKLLEVLNLKPGDRVLDMGCGSGKIAEYISDRTHAHVLGIDLAKSALDRARARTQEKRNRLEYQVGNMNNLSLPPASMDAIIAVDTLHFAENVRETVGQMKVLLKPHGQMGLFSSQYCLDNDTEGILLPDKTLLAQALIEHDLPFQTWDFTEREKEIHRLQLQVAVDLTEEFRKEGNLHLCEDMIKESEEDLERLDAGMKWRYLYHVRLP